MTTQELNKYIEYQIKKIYSDFINCKDSESISNIDKDILLDDTKKLYNYLRYIKVNDEKVDSKTEIVKPKPEIINPQHIESKEVEDKVKVVEEKVSHESVVEEVKENITDLKDEVKVSSEEIKEKAEQKEDDTSEIDAKANQNISDSEVHKDNVSEVNEEIKDELGESFVENSNSKLETSTKKQISDLLDLNTRIGLTQKFFKGSSIDLSECLMKMNQADTKDEYISIFNNYANKFKVQNTDEIYEVFMELIELRFK